MVNQSMLDSAYNYAARMLTERSRRSYDWRGAVHLALTQATRHWDSERNVSFSTYAHHLIRGHILDMLRKGVVVNHARKQSRVVTLPIESQYALVDDSATQAINRIERLDTLRSCLRYLNSKEKRLILLWLEGFTGNEIADMCKENRATIRAQLSRAKKFLMESRV